MWIKIEKPKKTAKDKVVEMNRRSKSDRRSFGRAAKFPVINRIGKLIKQDRRSTPDRRIANIHVKELDVHFDEKQFKKN